MGMQRDNEVTEKEKWLKQASWEPELFNPLLWKRNGGLSDLNGKQDSRHLSPGTEDKWRPAG